ncbi:MAG: B12-binding domain-containing radical SAM protein [Clostridia bacterium]|nr:B12-binding domain-containing radical SAM protein [Clostridia bacterium]
MKIVIACLNSKYIHASLSPWCLAAGVDAYSVNEFETCVMESTINKDVNEFAEKIIEQKPFAVGISCYIWNITKTLELCKIIKSRLNVPVILGGPEVSYRAENVLENYTFVDFVLSGEGEESFPLLLDTIFENGDFSNVDGLSYRSNNEIASIPEKECNGTPPCPYSSKYFENLNGRITYLETSRGCPYRCAFCLSGRCSPLRFFDIDYVKDSIIKLANSGTKTVKFVDRTFNANATRANEIISFIIDNHKINIPDGVCFHFEIAGDILIEDTFSLLEKAPKGLFQLEIGMQSFNEETLKTINRKTNTEKLIKNIKRLVSFNNMHIHIDLIAGLTGEDLKSFERSFNIGYFLKAHMLQMGFLKLLYGADMREESEKYPCEYTDEPPYEVTKTPWLSENEIKSLKKCEDALERLYNSGRFLLTLEYLIDEVGFEPFKLFYDFGNFVDGNKMNLSAYALKVYEFFFDKCDKDILIEKLHCDLLSCSSALQIPEAFKAKHPLYRRAKSQFTSNTIDKIKVAVLSKSERIFVVNQSGTKDLFGRYPSDFYEIDVLG